MASPAEIGVFTPEQARLIWQEYLHRTAIEKRRMIDEPSPHRVFVKNTSGETIPQYGCMQITGVEIVGDVTCLTVVKPTDTEGEYLFNSQYEIEDGANGWAFRFGVVLMRGDEPSQVGATYLPIVDSWEIEEGEGEFVVWGRHNANPRALIGRFAGGAGASIIHGIVRNNLGHGYYRIELSEWAGQSPLSSDTRDCTPCDDFVAPETGVGNCGDPSILEFLLQTAPKDEPEFVIAYDPQSVIVPLQVDTDCLITDTGATNDPVAYDEYFTQCAGETGSGDPVKIYQVVRGYQTHTVQYREEWECCDGVDTLVKRQAVIFAALVCDQNVCDECA